MEMVYGTGQDLRSEWRGLRMLSWLNLWPSRHLILHKAYADFRGESEGTYLGILWWVLDPLIYMLIFYFIFGVVMKRGGPGFIPFLIVGLTFWSYFQRSVSVAMKTLLKSVKLIRQVSFNRVVFPISAVLTNTFNFFFSLAVMLCVLVALKCPVHATWAALPVLLAVQVLVILAVALPLCAVVPFVPDLANLTDYVLRVVFYMSGVFFSIDKLPAEMQRVLRWNPMCRMLEFARGAMLDGRWPPWDQIAVMSGVSLVLAMSGAWLIHRFSGLYAKRIV